MILDQLRNMQDKVTYLLRNHPETRDDDQVLVTNIWFIEIKKFGNPETMSVFDFFRLYTNGKLSSADVITRARRKVQETNPDLRGKTWEERHKEAKRVRRDI